MSQIRIHLDEHVAAAIALGLRRRGIDVTISLEVGLSGAADAQHIEFARSAGRVIVTHDRDFARLHSESNDHAGIVYCHQDKYSVGELLAALVMLHGILTAEDMTGAFEFL
jgi:predicted nuclease of predicted toxin-antitoxin system